MAVRMRIESFSRDIKVILDEDLSPAGRSRILAETAREAIDEAAQQNERVLGRMPPHRTFVDGREGAALESVSPTGTIVAEFDLIDDMLIWIGTNLVQNSPVLTGRYSRSHVIVVDGTVLDAGAPLPAVWEEIVFLNTVPYARKIERGLSPQAPDGVYEGIATLASRRFGNMAKVRFSYRAPLFGMVDEWASTTKMVVRSRKGAKKAEWLRRQPAVVITPYR